MWTNFHSVLISRTVKNSTAQTLIRVRYFNYSLGLFHIDALLSVFPSLVEQLPEMNFCEIILMCEFYYSAMFHHNYLVNVFIKIPLL